MSPSLGTSSPPPRPGHEAAARGRHFPHGAGHRSLVRALAMATSAALVAAGLSGGGVFNPLELVVRDTFLRLGPRRQPQWVAVAAVDESSLARLGPWPWERGRLAELVERLHAAGSKVVVIDLLFPEPRQGDTRLAQALVVGPTVLAVAPTDGGWILPAAPLTAAALLGHAAFEPDRDGVVRRLPATKQSGESAYPALALLAATLIDPTRAVPVGRTLRPDFRLHWPRLQVLPAWQVLEVAPTALQLQGKVVFLGVTAAGLGDRATVPTAGQPLPGVVVHAGAADCFLAGNQLRRAPLALVAGAVACLGWAGWLMWAERRARWSVLAAAGILLSPTLAGAIALFVLGVETPTVVPTLVLAVLLVGAQTYRLRRTRAAATQLVATVTRGENGRARESRPEWEVIEQLALQLAQRQAADGEARRVMAHELKTPLTAVRGLTQLLAEYDLDAAERQRLAALAAREAQRLQAMVEGLVELERLSVRAFAETAQEIDLVALVRERVEVVAAGSGREVRWEGSAPVVIRADPALLRQMVDNLLGNACSYSPPHTAITVSVVASGGQAVLSVADRGPGVAREERQRIFNRFVRGTAAAGRAGLGLGLALVAEAVTWHGGTVEVADTPGGGATFVVRLPLLAS